MEATYLSLGSATASNVCEGPGSFELHKGMGGAEELDESYKKISTLVPSNSEGCRLTDG